MIVMFDVMAAALFIPLGLIVLAIGLIILTIGLLVETCRYLVENYRGGGQEIKKD